MKIDVFEEILDWDLVWLVERKEFLEELNHDGPMVFEYESVTLHHAHYEKESINISLQRVRVKGKHLVEKWGLEIVIKNDNPKCFMELNQATGESLAHTMDD